MIIVSELGYNYYDFNWNLYSYIYSNLIKEGFDTREKLWWHFLNIGEKNGYKFFNINDYKTYLEKYDHFDEYAYSIFMNRKYNKNLKDEGYITKYELWWYYITKDNNNETSYFNINERSKNLIQLFIKDDEPKKTIYYFIHHTCSNSIRTGIQIVTVSLAKEFLKIRHKYNFELIFVKWSDEYNSLVCCNKEDINNLFHLDEKQELEPKQEQDQEQEQYDELYSNILTNNYPIHTNYISFKNSIFFCPEIIFVIDIKLPLLLKNYLDNYTIKSIYILHDIIPLILQEYNFLKDNFKTYFDNNILHSNKIITNSNFTKEEFLRYTIKNKLVKSHFPEVKSILLPYQYRNKLFSKYKNNDNKVTILVAGTVEPRKQQIRLLRIFNDFLIKNPNIDVELIVFGRVIYICENDFFKEINKSNGKIKYLDIIDNEKLFELYKKATFTVFISKYEGYGFPIAESIWHGTPVLISNFGSMKEVASCGGCYYVDTNNDVSIYEGLHKLITDKELIQTLKNEIDENKLTTWSSYAVEIYENIFS